MTISDFSWKSAELLRAVLHISGTISGFPITAEIAISRTVQKMAMRNRGKRKPEMGKLPNGVLGTQFRPAPLRGAEIWRVVTVSCKVCRRAESVKTVTRHNGGRIVRNGTVHATPKTFAVDKAVGKVVKTNPKDSDSTQKMSAIEKSAAAEGTKKRKASEGGNSAKASTVTEDVNVTKKADGRPSKKSKPIDAVMEVAVEEEKTKQMQLAYAKSQSELNIEKVKADSAVKTQMIKAKAIESKFKSEEKRLKLQIKMKELELRERELSMSQASRSTGMGFGAFSSPLVAQSSQNPFERRSSSPFSQSGVPSPLDDQLLPQHAAMPSSNAPGFPGQMELGFSNDGGASLY
ncbi:hypothetical protein SCHPADRAFT_942493 [Schizopora paradoxa]|uniref:Uncharacterized protein n=1 Tax=Schizopora paradoxa TaxID=27342 RepID=A0A0H2RG71_9AGAM|nr:hypothetical protein SCHPADRAFT_942493 [Schizopora paradoxa]